MGWRMPLPFCLPLRCQEVFFNQRGKQAVGSGCANDAAVSQADEGICRKGRDWFAQAGFGVIAAEVDEDQAAGGAVISVSPLSMRTMLRVSALV